MATKPIKTYRNVAICITILFILYFISNAVSTPGEREVSIFIAICAFLIGLLFTFVLDSLRIIAMRVEEIRTTRR